MRQHLQESIRQLVPLHGLAPALQHRLAEDSPILQFNEQQLALEAGVNDSYLYYLLEGEMELLDGPQCVAQLIAGSEAARHALAPVQPRRLRGVTRTPVSLLQIERSLLDKLLVLDIDPNPRSRLDRRYRDPGWLLKVLRSELFVRIPAIYIKQIFDQLEAIQYSAGQTVIQEGEPGNYYYIIQRGRCTVTRKLTQHSPPVNLAELGPGNSFGEEALLAAGKRNATVTMVTDGVLMRLNRESFDHLIKKPVLSPLSYDQARKAIANGAVWLDVRFAEERLHCAIKDSLELPLSRLREELPGLPAGKHFIAYCDTGGRSSIAAFLLTEHGIHASHLDGGLISCPMTEHIRGRRDTPGTADTAQSAQQQLNKARRLVSRLRRKLSATREQRNQLLEESRQIAAQPYTSPADASETDIRHNKLLRETRQQAARKAEQLLQEYQETADWEYRQAEARCQAENQRLQDEIDRLRALMRKNPPGGSEG